MINIESVTDLSGFYVIYNGTIRNEKKGTRGISHFIEHLMCKGFEDILDDFEKYGISWNAYTSDTRVVYYLTGLDEYVKNYKQQFLDRLMEFNITESDLEIERKIILQEYSDMFNKQSSSHFLNLYRKLFDNYNPIGDFNDITNITLKDCVDYRNEFYNIPTNIINVSKYNPFDIDMKFNNFDNKYDIDYIINNKFDFQTSNIFKSKTSIIYLSKIIKQDFPYVNFVTSMLGSGLKSPLYQETREKNGLVYYINCYLDYLTDTTAIIKIATETNDESIELLDDAIYNIMENKEKYLTEERLDTVKKSYEIHYKKTEINRYSNVNKFMSPKEWLIEPILHEITLEKVYEIYDKYFNYDDFYVSYDKKEFLK